MEVKAQYCEIRMKIESIMKLYCKTMGIPACSPGVRLTSQPSLESRSSPRCIVARPATRRRGDVPVHTHAVGFGFESLGPQERHTFVAVYCIVLYTGASHSASCNASLSWGCPRPRSRFRFGLESLGPQERHVATFVAAYRIV